MPKRAALLASVVLILASVVAVAASVVATDASPWTSSAVPTIQNTIQLPSNVLPQSSNFDCTSAVVKVYFTSETRQDCLVTVPTGQVGDNGIVFYGSGNQIPVVPPYPYFTLVPIPNQSLLISYTSAPVIGTYLGFYRSIFDKLPPSPQIVGGAWQYILTKNPDFNLRDPSGKLLAANSRAMAFSPNGSWMIVDLPYQGFVRINLATFDMQPFAPSMNGGSDITNYSAQLSISNDGRYAAVKPSSQATFNVYDLANCTGTSLPVAANSIRCATRDYWPELSSKISGFRALYQPRFMNSDQLSITAVYDYVPGNYKVASYSLTAPGVDPRGISYLGMGDSFAAGEGAFEYTAETDTSNNRCHLSMQNYAFIFTRLFAQGGHAVSCSGAVMKDVTNLSNDYTGQVKIKIEKNLRDNKAQVLAAYTPGFLAQNEFVDLYRPEAVTLSIGGNDIGFADILSNCVSPTHIPSTCYSYYEDRLELFRQVGSIFDQLVGTYQSVLKPGKRVYVIGYPQIVASGGNCANNVHLDESEIRLANDLTDYLNETISRAADKAGVRYVDVSQALVGSRLCEAKSWNVAVNGLTAGGDAGVGPVKFIGSESYHPNALGQQLLSQVIRTKTNNLTQPMPAPSASTSAPSVPPALDTEARPKSGRPLNTVVTNRGLTPDIAYQGQPIAISVDSASGGLRPLASYRIVLAGTTIGSATADAMGHLSTTIQIPSTAANGFQSIDLLGPNLLGQNLDVTRSIYIGASPSDLNGDGVPDSGQSCGFIQASGVDSDRDGIDDACDGLIAEPPPQKLSHLTGSVTLTSNSITATR